MCFTGNFVSLSVLLSFVSGLIMPMKKPSGDPDMDSVINHVTLLEQTMVGFQTQVTDLTTVKIKLQTAEQTIISLQNQAQTSSSELTTLKVTLLKTEEELKASKDEITAVKAELKLAETDIAVLKHDLQRNPDSKEFTQLKNDFEALKASHNALVQQVNFTVIDAVSADVKSNTRDNQSLKSRLVKTEFEVNKTSADVANLTTEVPIMIKELNQSLQDAVLTKADLAILKSQLTDVSQSMNATTNNIHSLEAQVTYLETGYNSFRHRQDTTEHDAVNNKANIAILKTQLTEVSKTINTTSTNINSLETRLTSAETQYNTFRSKQNITEHEVAECKALAQSGAADLKTAHNQVQTVQTETQTIKSQVQTVQTQVNTVSTDVHGLRGELTTFRNKTNKDVAFQVTQSITDAGWKTLKFDTVEYNTGNSYNKTTGVFTAPTSGTYILWASVLFINNGDGNNMHFIYISHGPQRVATGACYLDTSGSYCGVYPTITTHLDGGDQVYFRSGHTTSDIQGAGESSYGGALLHVS